MSRFVFYTRPHLGRPSRAETFPLESHLDPHAASHHTGMIIVHIVKVLVSCAVCGNYFTTAIFASTLSLQLPSCAHLSSRSYPPQSSLSSLHGLHKSYKRKVPQQGTCVMHHHYKKPDVCQPFKTTRDCDKRRLSCLSPSEGRALNGINSASGGIATGGWALHLQECPRCCHRPHTHTQKHLHTHSCMLREAQQEQLPKKKQKITMALFEDYNEYSSV